MLRRLVPPSARLLLLLPAWAIAGAPRPVEVKGEAFLLLEPDTGKTRVLAGLPVYGLRREAIAPLRAEIEAQQRKVAAAAARAQAEVTAEELQVHLAPHQAELARAQAALAAAGTLAPAAREELRARVREEWTAGLAARRAEREQAIRSLEAAAGPLRQELAELARLAPILDPPLARLRELGAALRAELERANAEHDKARAEFEPAARPRGRWSNFSGSKVGTKLVVASAAPT
jgi:hypothetical protein